MRAVFLAQMILMAAPALAVAQSGPVAPKNPATNAPRTLDVAPSRPIVIDNAPASGSSQRPGGSTDYGPSLGAEGPPRVRPPSAGEYGLGGANRRY